MGEGIKLPEDQRPSISSIWAKVDKKIPKVLQNVLVMDVQNDCGCTIEKYDTEPAREVVYLTSEGIKEATFAEGRLPLPMLDDISEADIWSVMQRACELATESFPEELVISKMLFNPHVSRKDLLIAFERWSRPARIKNRYDELIMEYYDWISAPFVPMDCVYFIPDPEFLGCISVNVDKFGVFCIPKHIAKKPL